MSYKLGIRTPYSHCEATYAAMRIADWAEQRGIDVSILTVTDNPPLLSDEWDSRVTLQHSVKFAEWVDEQDSIVWLFPPAEEQLRWVKKMGKHTIGVVFWHLMRPGHAQLYKHFDTLVTPAHAASDLFRVRWGRDDIVVAPWEPGLPTTIKDPNRPEHMLRVLLPVLDHMPDRTTTEALGLAARLVESGEAMITVAYTPSQLRPAGVKYLQQLVKRHPDNCRLVASPSIANRPFLFHQHELTVWPTHSEDIGMLGMTSLAMGTPVAAFDVPPLDEFLMRENSLLLPCDITYSETGAPSAVPDYQLFGDKVLDLIGDCEHLRQLEKNASLNLNTRRAAFNSSWDVITEVNT